MSGTLSTDTGHDSYGCRRCGRMDGLDAIAPNEIWAALTDGRIAAPSGEVVDSRWQVLCLWCMDSLAAQKGLTCSVSLHFCGRALTGTSQSDRDQADLRWLSHERNQLIEKLNRCSASHVRLFDENARLRSLLDDAERLIMAHHDSAIHQVKPGTICQVCAGEHEAVQAIWRELHQA